VDTHLSTSAVAHVIDERPLSRFQLWTIALCGIVVILDGFDTQCMGFLVPVVAEDRNIPLSAFGPVLAAALFGLMIAAMASGPIADRYGRRSVVIASVVVFAVFALLTARANTLRELILFRFLTGLGLGGAMPNAVALTAEYTPKRLQPVVVGAIFVGMPAGALIASQAASVLIPLWGWRSVFVVGGILPLLLAVVLIPLLPESVRFLSASGADPAKVTAIMRRIAPDLAHVPVTATASRDEPRRGVPVKHLFTEGRAIGTLLLWVPFFMNLLILYFILSWLPALLRQSGMPATAGVRSVAMFSIGGIIGTLGQGTVMNALGARTVLLIEFLLCTLLIASLAFSASSFGALMIATLALGVCVQGAQAGLNALAASFYPTAVRATGIGWALGIGRIGSIVGPSLGGVLLSLQWSPQQIFMAGIGPAVCAAAAVVFIGWLPERANAFRTAA
jgi:AAHS family 4-hydroxybenzoate transporter-like MFS transporter